MTATSENLSMSETPGIAWRKQIRFAMIGALSSVFVALAGMPVGLDRRSIVYPVLSMGYLSLLWIPFVLARLAGSETVLEGMTARARGTKDLLAGGFVGLGSAGGLALLMVLIQNF